MELTAVSDEAANYDSKHEKSLRQLTEAIHAKLEFIGAEWVDGEDEDDDDGPENEKTDSDPKRLRLLDYACGTGMISRVRFDLSTPKTMSVKLTVRLGLGSLYHPVCWCRYIR